MANPWDVLDQEADRLLLAGRFAEAAAAAERALAMVEVSLGVSPSELAEHLHTLGCIRRLEGRAAEGEALHRRAVEIQERALGDDHPDVARGLNFLGLVLHARQKFGEAEAVYRRALGILERVGLAEGDLLPMILNNRGEVLFIQERLEEAEVAYREGLKTAEQVGDLGLVAVSCINLGHLLRHPPGTLADRRRGMRSSIVLRRSLAARTEGCLRCRTASLALFFHKEAPHHGNAHSRDDNAHGASERASRLACPRAPECGRGGGLGLATITRKSRRHPIASASVMIDTSSSWPLRPYTLCGLFMRPKQ